MYHVQGTHVVPGMSEIQARRARAWEKPAMVAALLVIPYLLVNFYTPGGRWEAVADAFYLLLWGFFVVEAAAMIWLAPDNWEWVRHNALDVAIILATAPISVWPREFEVVQVLWLLRLLDLLPLFHRRLFRITVIRFAFILWSLTIFGGGIAFATLESTQEEAPGLLEGIYWANTTVSTVGYGDWLPHTVASVLLTIPMQAMGVVLGAILVAGILPKFDREFARGFSAAVAQQVTSIATDVDEMEENVEDIEADVEAIAHGEVAQDRVLAQMARDLSALKRHVGVDAGPAATSGAAAGRTS